MRTNSRRNWRQLLSLAVCLIISLRGIGLGQPAVLTIKFHLPSEIVDYIKNDPNADLRRLFDSLRIKGDNDAPSDCRGACEAEILPVKIPSRPGGIIISISNARNYWYLFFENIPNDQDLENWRFHGHVKFIGQQYGPPEPRAVEKNGRAWLVVKMLWGRGTGLARYGEMWVNIDGNPAKEVLVYPIRGHEMMTSQPYYISRAYEGAILGTGLTGRFYAVQIQLSISYASFDENAEGVGLFDKKQLAYYVWNETTKRFDLNESRSNITVDEIEDSFGGSLSDTKFVEYNYRHLQKLVLEGDLRQKKWLKGFLKSVDDIPKKRVLQKLLRAQGIYDGY